jgi:biotin-(acetyl-CoA carboxylase) ligase
VDRVAFARRLYEGLEPLLDACAEGGFDAVRPRFEARFRMVGRAVRVVEAGGTGLDGRVRGLDADGALLVERDGGGVARVVAGDVTLAKEAP